MKEYFDLHEGIKHICGKYPLETLNPSTLNKEASIGVNFKMRFYVLSWVGAVCIIISGYVFLHFLAYSTAIIEPPHLEIKEEKRRLQCILAAFTSIVFFVLGLVSIVFARRHYNYFKGDDESRLLEDAYHPGLAHQIYKAVYTVLDQKVPISILRSGRTSDFPIHSVFGSHKKNAMLFLLGNGTHRQALWKEGPVPKGAILMNRKYHHQILGNLSASIKAYNETTKDNRDNRALLTALLHEKHMRRCVAVMASDTFWKNKRKTAKRIKIIGISKTLLKYWPEWEVLRPEVRNAFSNTVANSNRRSILCEQLLDFSGQDTSVLIDILTGRDRATAEFFRKLQAINESDLVSEGTTVETKTFF